MKYIYIIIVAVVTASAILLLYKSTDNGVVNPISSNIDKIIEKPFDKYTIEALKERQAIPSAITIDKIIKEDPEFTAYLFYFITNKYKVSGMLTIPKEKGTYPIIEMHRGYADKVGYQTGNGTRRAAEVFATNGFITIAPDFLNYGQSDVGPDSSIENRFMNYTTVLDLLASLPILNDSLQSAGIVDVQADPSKVGIWGHSNGGQISLSILSITGKEYPTSLWNPVSKPFPYTILFFTDEDPDHGKALRKVVADFEDDYDIEKYSSYNYYNWINAPIQLHQGTADEQVPLRWSDHLYNLLDSMDKDITYYTYLNDDHNFAKGSWSTVVARDLAFYNKYLNNE